MSNLTTGSTLTTMTLREIVTIMWAGGKLVHKGVDVFKPLPKLKADKEDLDTTKKDLEVLKKELATTNNNVNGMDANLNTITEKVFSNP